MAKYDEKEAQRILARAGGERGVKEVVQARVVAARELLAALATLDGKCGIRAGLQTPLGPVHVGFVDGGVVSVSQADGEIYVGPADASRDGERSRVTLAFDPVDGVLLGPPRDAVNAMTGERRTVHGDALAAVAQAVVDSLWRRK